MVAFKHVKSLSKDFEFEYCSAYSKNDISGKGNWKPTDKIHSLKIECL